jgi:hypothetical protein
MLSKYLAVCLALSGLLLTSSAMAGENVIRLASPDSDANTLNLLATDDDLDADTIDVQRWGRGGYRGGYGYRGFGYGGYRGYYGGYRPYYYGYRPFYYGYRPYYYNYYRPYYGYYRPYYYNSYYYNSYWPYYWGISYPSYSFGLSIGYSGYYPIWGRSAVTRSLVIQPSPSYAEPSQPDESLPGTTPQPQMPKADEGTYPYDGGPMNPVPVPMQEARPSIVPYAELHPEERFVSLTPDAPTLLNVKSEPKTGKWNYPAYGEKPTRGGK